MPYPRALLIFAFALVGSFTDLSGQASDPSPSEGPLKRGVLPNGLHYVVLSHASANGDIALRLVVNAGSLDERDDERGFAHFVEHTAFNGTRQFPPGTVRRFFETLGLRFGADLNASTSHTHTHYLLNLPESGANRIDDALLLLRDYADGQLFPPEEVKRESLVVLSELRARDSAGTRMAKDMLNVIYAGTRVPERDPIGVPEQIERATADQLRAFYRRNYTPGRMTVAIVGPINVAAMVGKIAASFGSMTAAAESVAPAAAIEPPRASGVKTDVIVLPTFKSAVAEFNFVTPRPPDTLEGRRQELVQHVATTALDRRLEAEAERETDHYSRPQLGFNPSPVAPSLIHHTIKLGTRSSVWDDAVTLVESELRRARGGFSQAEVDEAVAIELTSRFNRIASATGQSSSAMADGLVATIIENRAWQTPAVRHAEAKIALQGLAAAEVTAASAAIFPPDSCQLTLLIEPKTPVKPDRLLAAYHKSAGRALKKSATTAEELHFRYEDFGPAGSIAKRERIEDLDLTLVSFENGARLNIRPTTFEPGRFRLRILFPQNLSNVPDDRGGIAELAGQLLLNTSLKKHKQTELIRLLRLHGVSPQFSVMVGVPSLSISGPATELSFALQLVTAWLTDLDFDDEFYRVALSHYSGLFRGTVTSAGGLGLREALRTFAGDDPRTLLLSPQFYANDTSLSDAESWLRTHILDGPLEVGLVGDFTADDAVTRAAATLGTLKRRKPAPTPGAPLSMPKKSNRRETIADLPASTSFSVALWPVTLPDDPKHNAALALASDLLRDRLILVVREAIGASYSPTTLIHRDIVQRNFAYLAMINTFEPATARQYTDASVRLAARIAERSIGAEDFERIREPARSRYAQDMHSNAWWLDTVVSVAQSRPDVLEEARRHEKILDQVTIEDVNQAAQVFKSDRVTIVIVRPKSVNPPGTTVAPTKK